MPASYAKEFQMNYFSLESPNNVTFQFHSQLLLFFLKQSY